VLKRSGKGITALRLDRRWPRASDSVLALAIDVDKSQTLELVVRVHGRRAIAVLSCERAKAHQGAGSDARIGR